MTWGLLIWSFACGLLGYGIALALPPKPGAESGEAYDEGYSRGWMDRELMDQEPAS